MNQNLRVLLVGAGKRVSLALELRAAASRAGVDVDVFAYEASTEVPVASEAQVVVGRRFSDPMCGEHLAEVCATLGVNVAIACHDSAVRFLPELPTSVFAPSCSPELIGVFGSKRQSSKYFRDLGLNVPPAPNGPPAIAKPDFGSSSKGLVYLRSDGDFRSFMGSDSIESFEVQRELSGPEFTVDAYKSTVSGRTYAAQRIRLETSGGEVVRTATVDESDIARQMDVLLGQPDVVGPLTAQFIWDETEKKFFIMEVNARFGGGMPASVAAGCPLIDVMLDDYLGMPVRDYAGSEFVLVARSFREHVFKRDDPYSWRNHG